MTLEQQRVDLDPTLILTTIRWNRCPSDNASHFRVLPVVGFHSVPGRLAVPTAAWENSLGVVVEGVVPSGRPDHQCVEEYDRHIADFHALSRLSKSGNVHGQSDAHEEACKCL